MYTIASHSQLNISETVRLPRDYQQEMTYRDLNGHVIDDVTWPRDVKLVTPLLKMVKNGKWLPIL